MRPAVWFLTLSLPAVFGPDVRAGGPPVAAPPPRIAADPREGEPSTFAGVITAVDGQSVTVRGFGAGVQGHTGQRSDLDGRGCTFFGNGPIRVTLGGVTHVCTSAHRRKEVWTLTLLNGEARPIRLEEIEPIRFPADEVLTAGRYHEDEMAASSYRLADVCVGDEVVLACRRAGGVAVCRAISISRRPGGRVPQAPGQKPGDRINHADSQNAYADRDERGIPLPAKYDPRRGMEEARAAFEYAKAREWQRERTAPPPREAKPK